MAIQIVNFARDSSEAQLEPNDEAVFNFDVRNTWRDVIKCTNVTLTFENIPSGITINEGTTVVCGDIDPGTAVQKSITITTNVPAVGGDFSFDITPHYSITALSQPENKKVTIHVVHD